MGHYFHLGSRERVEDELDLWGNELVNRGRPYAWDIAIGSPEAILDTEPHRDEVRVKVEDARRYFAELYRPLIDLVWRWSPGTRGERTWTDEFIERVPPRSLAWENLLRFCNLFDLKSYTQVRDFLSRPHGADSILYMWYADGLHLDTSPERVGAMMDEIARRNALLQTFSPEALTEIPFTEGERSRTSNWISGFYQWAMAYLDGDAAYSFTLYLLGITDEEATDEWGIEDERLDERFEALQYALYNP